MFVDALLQLSASQAVTASAVSTNTIDLSQARDLGPGADLYATFGVEVAALAAGAATVTFQIISSASANLSSPTILTQSDAIGKAELTIGKAFSIPLGNAILAAQAKGQRYLGVQYTVGTGPLTAGTFSCYLTTDCLHDVKAYPSGFTVA
jgi:hypothetical protein